MLHWSQSKVFLVIFVVVSSVVSASANEDSFLSN